MDGEILLPKQCPSRQVSLFFCTIFAQVLLGTLMVALLGAATAQVMEDVGQVYNDPTFSLYGSGERDRIVMQKWRTAAPALGD